MLDGGRCVGACRCEGCLVSGLCCVVRYTHFYHELVMCNGGGQHCTMYLKQLKRWMSISLQVGAGGNGHYQWYAVNLEEVLFNVGTLRT